MPLYEYECEECEHRFERIRKFSDEPLSTCPVCSGPVRKLASAPAIQFKGTGWYITDYSRKSGDGKSEGGNDAESAKSANGADGKPSSDGKSSGADAGSSGSDGKSSAGASSGSDTPAKPKSGSASGSASSSSAPG